MAGVGSVQNALTRARNALAARKFRDAERTAETLLLSRLPKDARASALLIAADAAYGTRSYRQAARRYRELLSQEDPGPEAPRAAMALGWSELRDGERDLARASWIATAERFPADPRAPLALLLAADVAKQAGDTEAAGGLLGRVIEHYPSTVHAGTARLNRSILSLRGQREDEAVRDLDEVIRSYGSAAIDHRRKTMNALAVPGAEAALPLPAGAEMTTVPSDKPIERFAASVLQAGEAENAPYMLHGLALLAAANGGWSDVVVADLVHQLVDRSPSYPFAPALLARVAASAASSGHWPTARRAYEELLTRYPTSAVSTTARVDYAEALLRVGAKGDARAQLRQVVASGREDRPRVLLLLAELEEALGAPDRARPLLQRIVAASDGEAAGEAAYRIGRILSAEGRHAAAIEWYLTAAYVVEGSRSGRQALLDAGRSLVSLDRTREALLLYRKIMPKPFARAPRDGSGVPALFAGVEQLDDRDVRGEAAYRIAEILHGVGDEEAALDMYLTAANLTAETPAAGRPLVGAIRSLVTMGDRPAADAMYRRLLDSTDTDPALLAEARATLQGGAAQDGAAALPRGVRD